SLKMSGSNVPPYKHHEVVNISVRDYLAERPSFRLHAKGYRVGVDFPERAVPLEPYYLGLWLGDGTSANENITTGDDEIVSYLHSLACRYGLEVKVKDRTGNAITYSITRSSSEGDYRCFNHITRSLRRMRLLK